MIEKNSTKQIDAVWIVHDASNTRSYLEAIFYRFEDLLGPEMLGMTTIIINKCDIIMERGDYFQCPKEVPFNLPEDYNDVDEDIR